MEQLLVTYEDVKNELGQDLATLRGESPNEINIWLRKQQNKILDFIGSCAFGGAWTVDRFLHDPTAVAIIRKAILRQIDYKIEIKFVDTDRIVHRDGEAYYPDIDENARKLLENSGLLYTGKFRK